MASRIPWARVIAEGLVIVASVVLGLGIDAWWDDRTATREAHQALQGVLAEFEEARAEIARGELQHGVFHESTNALRERLLVVDAGGTVSVPDTLLIGLTLITWATDPPTALLQSFVSEGHLVQLGNNELRQLILRWGPRLDDLQGDELRVRDFMEQEVTPYVSSVADLAIAWETVTAYRRIRGPRRYAGGLQTSDDDPLDHHTDLPATLSLRNLVTKSVDQLGLLRFQSSQALIQLDLLTSAIEQELTLGQRAF